MKRGAVLWTLAVVSTLVAASWQRRTGPSYPLRTSHVIAGDTQRVRLLRSHVTTAPAPVTVVARDTTVAGTLTWRRYPTDDAFASLEMRRQGDTLVAELPTQPPAGKVEYYVELRRNAVRERVPGDRAVVLRYRGEVPGYILVPHILLMFVGLLIGSRAALGALAGEGDQRRLVVSTVIVLTVGGLVLGPIVQKHAFGAYWTGIPFGWDLTDNKTLVMWIGWVAAALTGRRAVTRWVVIVAAALMLAAYVIPHSTLGSQLDYSTVPSP